MWWLFAPDFFTLLHRELAPVAARLRLRKVGSRRACYMNEVVYANESRLLVFRLDHVEGWFDVRFGSVAELQPDGTVVWLAVAEMDSLLRLCRADRPWNPWFEGGGLELDYDKEALVRAIVAGIERHEREVFTPWEQKAR